MIRLTLAGLIMLVATLPVHAREKVLHLICTTNPVQSEIWNLDFAKTLVSSKYYDERPVEFTTDGETIERRSAQFGFEYLLDPTTLTLVERDHDGLAIYRCRTTARRP